MPTKSLFSRTMVWAAAIGFMIQSVPCAAYAAESAGPVIRDIAMTSAGVFQGQFIGQDGQPVSAAQVVVRGENEADSEAITDAEGRFEIAGLAPGVYQVTAGDTTQQVRVWTNAAAPPSAASTALISQNVVRAQGFYYDYGTMGVVLGLVGIGLGTAALIELDDCCDHSTSP